VRILLVLSRKTEKPALGGLVMKNDGDDDDNDDAGHLEEWRV
jgi:hypothetical protein